MGLFKKGKNKKAEEDLFGDLEDLKKELEVSEKPLSLQQNQLQQMFLPAEQPRMQQIQPLGLPPLEQPFPQPLQQPQPIGQQFQQQIKPPVQPQKPLQQEQKVEPQVKKSESEKSEIYVKLDDYKRLLEILEKLKLKLREIESYVNELKEIKENEVTKIEDIKNRIENSKEDISSILDILK